MPQPNLPTVSVVMPMYNEEKYIVACLTSILETDYPLDRLEILVVDGASSDQSAAIVQQFAEDHPQVKLLHNPKRIIPAALNVGIQAATSDYVVRMDAHCQYATSYIRECIETLSRTGADNAGGAQRAVGTGWLGTAIATAVSSPLAAGDAKYRAQVQADTEVDTVFLGSWKRSTLINLGGYREDLPVNEDYELNIRLRKLGGRIVLSNSIQSEYYPRTSLRTLARQYARYGYWKAKTVSVHPTSLRWRQLVAPAFVLACIVAALLAPYNRFPGIFLLGLYCAAVLAGSVLTARRCGWSKLLVLPFIFGTIHFGWGSGFLIGWTRFKLISSGS